MKRAASKHAASRLDPRSYYELRREILKRDGWRCQQCGARLDLQVHHIKWRSQLGDDANENLITLCVTCHRRIHRRAPTRPPLK